MRPGFPASGRRCRPLILAAAFTWAGPTGIGAQQPAASSEATWQGPRSTSTTLPPPAQWEMQVLLAADSGLFGRARPLFRRDRSDSLSAPSLGDRVLGWLRRRGIVMAGPGPVPPRADPGLASRPRTRRADPDRYARIAGRSYRRVEDPSARTTEWWRPGAPAPTWTVAVGTDPDPFVSLSPPIALPLIPSRIEVGVPEVVWVIRHGADGDPVWAVGFGPVGEGGAFRWSASWRSPRGAGPDPREMEEVPAELVRHAHGRYGAYESWRPVRTLTGALASVRYNRVEGGSIAVPVEVELSPVFRLDAWTRFNTSSLPPTAGLALTVRRWPVRWGVEAFRHLQDANRWDPAEQDRGNSLSAFLRGQDEGHYYVAEGGRLFVEGGRAQTGWTLELIAQSDRPAPPRVDYSLFPGDTTIAAPGPDAERGSYYGIGGQLRHQVGLGLAEGVWEGRFWTLAAGGSRPFLRVGGTSSVVRSGGRWAAGARVGLGAALGDPPVQRQHFAGGVTTVRGFLPATLVGPALALTRLEVGYGPPVARVVAFGDAAWAGSLDDLGHAGSLGLGISLAEGVLRFDLAVPVTGGGDLSLHVSGDGLL